MAMLANGAQINGRYQLEKLLGQGGMAEVYRAIDLEKNSVVALKILSADQLSEARKIARFRREFEILSKFKDENIIGIGEQGVYNESIPFFTMEYIQGETLASFLEERSGGGKNGRQVSETLGILIQVANGLKHIHDKGVVFCDLTPSNIFLVKASEDKIGPKVKIIDFGISRILDNQTDEDRESKAGTPAYMSPEQYRRENIDTRSDIYSYGILAFELLTGRVPYKTEIEYKVEFLHQMAHIPSARDVNRDVPPTLDRLLKRCMEKERFTRAALSTSGGAKSKFLSVQFLSVLNQIGL